MERIADYSSENARLTHGAPFFSMMIVGLAVLAFLDGSKGSQVSTGRIASSCEVWDQRAVEGIAPLISDDSAAGERKLNEALTQLRRARTYCRAGSVSVAQNDYLSLHRAFPITTGSIQPTKTSSTPDRVITKTSVTR